MWMAAKNASVSHVHEFPPDTLGCALVSGCVPQGYLSNLTHLLEEAPVPLVVTAVEKAAANEVVAPKAVRHKVAKLARSLAAVAVTHQTIAQWPARVLPATGQFLFACFGERDR